MTLQDIFDELTYGELSQLAIGGRQDASGEMADDPEIAEEDRPGIIRHINTALTALYTRFRLREKTVFLILQPDKSTYVLDSKFLINNTSSNAPIKYLLDSEDDVFDNSLLKIEQISALRTELGMPSNPRKPYAPLALNITNDPFSIRTPSTKIIRIPDIFTYDFHTPTKLKIDYRAQHEKIDILFGSSAPIAVEIELPVTHLQALLYYVASRILNPTGMVEEFHSGNSYYAKYEAECQRLEVENMQIDDMEQNSNFERQGFV